MEPDNKRRRCNREDISKERGKSKREINKMINTLSLDEDVKKKLKYYNGKYFQIGRQRLSYRDGKYHNAHTILHLDHMYLDDNGIKNICEAFRNGYKTDDISLRFNDISSEGVIILLETLMECGIYLYNINLGYNHYINDDCMRTLGEYIQFDRLLETVYIGDYTPIGISDKGIEIITPYIVGNTTLRIFEVHNRGRITNASAPYLEQIAKQSYVRHMWSTLHHLDDRVKEEIETCLFISPEEREIPIFSNTKSAAKATHSHNSDT